MRAPGPGVVEEVVRRSVAWRLVDRIVTALSRATATSALVGAAADLMAVVQAWNCSTSRRAIGSILLTAALVNVGLTAWQEVPPAWQWLILPGLAAVSGLLLVATSGREPAI